MNLLSGIVIDGKIVLQGSELPEGAQVTVLARPQEDFARLPPDLLAELNEAIAEADADENSGITPEELFEQLKKYR